MGKLKPGMIWIPGVPFSARPAPPRAHKSEAEPEADEPEVVPSEDQSPTAVEDDDEEPVAELEAALADEASTAAETPQEESSVTVADTDSDNDSDYAPCKLIASLLLRLELTTCLIFLK